MSNPKVSIIDATGTSCKELPDGSYAVTCDPKYAAALLAFTKNTRLEMKPHGLYSWLEKPIHEIQDELDYMVNTIRSSWEFVDITFLIRDVSRACAQQITRSRLASFAMQSQRVTDMSGASHHIPARIKEDKDKLRIYEEAFSNAMVSYGDMLESGFEKEDARGILPVNLHCNLIAKYNLRVLVDLVHARTSSRAQGEYQDIAHQMKEQVLMIYPWAENFFKPKNELAVGLIKNAIKELHDGDLRRNLAKAVDMIS